MLPTRPEQVYCQFGEIQHESLRGGVEQGFPLLSAAKLRVSAVAKQVARQSMSTVAGSDRYLSALGQLFGVRTVFFLYGVHDADHA